MLPHFIHPVPCSSSYVSPKNTTNYLLPFRVVKRRRRSKKKLKANICPIIKKKLNINFKHTYSISLWSAAHLAYVYVETKYIKNHIYLFSTWLCVYSKEVIIRKIIATVELFSRAITLKTFFWPIFCQVIVTSVCMAPQYVIYSDKVSVIAAQCRKYFQNHRQ